VSEVVTFMTSTLLLITAWFYLVGRIIDRKIASGASSPASVLPL
jgi:hypothetical protein